MSFTLHKPSPADQPPAFDCIFCKKPALVSSEADSTDTTRTQEVFCRHCGARKTMTVRRDADHWEPAE